jgi:hypothetical protein
MSSTPLPAYERADFLCFFLDFEARDAFEAADVALEVVVTAAAVVADAVVLVEAAVVAVGALALARVPIASLWHFGIPITFGAERPA